MSEKISPSSGPWVHSATGEANFYRFSTPERWLMVVHQNGELSVEKQEANCRMIAASHAMLEQLRCVLARNPYGVKINGRWDDWRDDIIDLIAFIETPQKGAPECLQK
ncbi:MAG: hypothetical protein E6Q97_34225 [Desulfurellales bacterium]|nr:MAG: hypothetical protein E6Q97_34225 [Desulfurellales bacterium]